MVALVGVDCDEVNEETLGPVTSLVSTVAHGLVPLTALQVCHPRVENQSALPSRNSGLDMISVSSRRREIDSTTGPRLPGTSDAGELLPTTVMRTVRMLAQLLSPNQPDGTSAS